MKAYKIMAALMALAMMLTALSEEYFPENQAADNPLSQDVVVDQMYDVSEFAVTEGLPDNWVNFLLLGADTRNASQYGSTDGIMILSMNLATRQAKLTSIVRDVWVTMSGRSQRGKLSSVCAQGGPALVMRTLNECFGLNLQYYALINLSGMAEAIDLLGGLDMDVTLDELNALNQGLFDLSPHSGMEKLLEYGSDVHLNGNQAVAYARIRKLDSDYKRTERDRYLMGVLARRIQKENSGTIVGVVMKLLDCVETNMNITQLMTIAAVGLEVDMDRVPTLCVPVEGTYKSGTFNVDGGKKVWCVKADFTENSKELLKFIYGQGEEPSTDPAAGTEE